MKNDERGIKDHPVVSRAKWLSARKALLAQEKDFTHLRDQLSALRRKLPWVKVEKAYVFDGPSGKVTLAELFENRSQLIVYHFMFSPESSEGCKHCSFWADNFNGIGVHLNHRDVTFVVISRAPLSKIKPFQKRMGWSFKWVSSFHNDFNHDYHVSFSPQEVKTRAVYNYARTKVMADREGVSVFHKDQRGIIYHTYSCYARGIDMLNGAYHYLDLAPKGRDEDGLEFTQSWVQYHDRYKD